MWKELLTLFQRKRRKWAALKFECLWLVPWTFWTTNGLHSNSIASIETRKSSLMQDNLRWYQIWKPVEVTQAVTRAKKKINRSEDEVWNTVSSRVGWLVVACEQLCLMGLWLTYMLIINTSFKLWNFRILYQQCIFRQKMGMIWIRSSTARPLLLRWHSKM